MSSKLETFVWILNHISRSITWSPFTLKTLYLVKWPISTWSFMWWCQFINWLKMETHPSSLLNFGTAYWRKPAKRYFPCQQLYISYERYYWLIRYKRRYDVNTAFNQVHQAGKGESAWKKPRTTWTVWESGPGGLLPQILDRGVLRSFLNPNPI